MNKKIMMEFAQYYKSEKTFGIYSDDEIYYQFQKEQRNKYGESSSDVIGEVKDKFNNLARYKFDYKSFYNGWIEGRMSLLFKEENK